MAFYFIGLSKETNEVNKCNYFQSKMLIYS